MSADDIVVTGIAALRHTPGETCSAEAAVLPWLKNPKSRKFMGKQDELAVASAGQRQRDVRARRSVRPRTQGRESVGASRLTVNQVETATFDIARTPTDRFRSWWKGWLSDPRNMVRVSVYKHEDKTDTLPPGCWVSSTILDLYNKDVEPEFRFPSLKEFAVQMADEVGITNEAVLDATSGT